MLYQLNLHQLPPQSFLSITNSGASGFYFVSGTPVFNYNSRPLTVGICVTNGSPEHSVASATLSLASALPLAAMLGYVCPCSPLPLLVWAFC